MLNDPVNSYDPLGLEGITASQGQQIVNVAKTWEGVPYLKGAGSSSGKAGADCSGAVCQIYKEAGLPYDYSSSADFPNNPAFEPVPGNNAQQGDVGRWEGHLLIYDANAGGRNDSWSARRPGKPFGPAETGWWKGPPQWYRYKKPEVKPNIPACANKK